MRPDVVSARTDRSAPRGRPIFLRKTSARQLVEDEGFRESAQRIRRGHGCSREEPRRGILRTGANRDSSGLDAALFTHGATTKPVPCLLLGQLATDLKWAGRGVGTALLADALRRSVRAAELVGGRALVVKAIDVEAAEFWRRRGFQPSRDDEMILFRALADIARAIREA
jgi:GNAT superfamily N-acetyltransferase